MKTPVPFGFYVCGLLSALFGVAALAAQAILLPPMDDESGGHILVRGLAMLLVPLSAVATEALWRARRWAYRASLSLALVYAATLTTGAVVTEDNPVLGTFLLCVAVSAVVVVPVLAYIRTRSARMWPQPGVPAPRRPRVT